MAGTVLAVSLFTTRLIGVGYSTPPSGGVAMASCSRFVVPDLPLTPHQPSGHRFPKRAFGKKNRAAAAMVRPGMAMAIPGSQDMASPRTVAPGELPS